MRMVITPINRYGMSHFFLGNIHSVAIIDVTAYKKYNCNPDFPLDILKNMKSKNNNDNE
jgi:hypothetical protein